MEEVNVHIKKKKRQRGENWAREEKRMFLEIMRESAPIIENKKTDTNSNRRKYLEWIKVQKKFKQLTGTHRNIDQLKSSWKRLKSSAKKNVSEHKKAIQATGGEIRLQSPSEDDRKVMEFCKNDFIDETNEFDCDRVINDLQEGMAKEGSVPLVGEIVTILGMNNIEDITKQGNVSFVDEKPSEKKIKNDKTKQRKIDRLQPVHPKKQLFLTPVNKFTAKWSTPSPNLARIRSCLDEYKRQDTPIRPANKAKAASMEDLTPTKRVKVDKKNGNLPILRSPGVDGASEQTAAVKICRFMLMVAWRRRREDVRCLRKTLETQVSYSERLRIQICALKSLLDSDNAKVRLAMRELERLKQLLRDKEMEKSVLEREKSALEDDVCAAEDRASEMSIGWRNCRNELEGVRAGAAGAERALALERAAAADARQQRDHALHRLTILEADLALHENLLQSAETAVAELRREADEKRKELEDTSERLRIEQEARERCALECRSLSARVAAGAAETSRLREELDALRGELAGLRDELRLTRERLDWWPRPLTKMLGAARSWFSYSKAVPEAVMWTLIPARHGC